MKPRIGGNRHDFHDSTLARLAISPQLDQIEAVLAVSPCTEKKFNGCSRWLVRFHGVLRFEFEASRRAAAGRAPVEIVDVCVDTDDAEVTTWRRRLTEQGVSASHRLAHVVIATSDVRGWDQELDGIHVICEGWTIEPAG